MSERLTPDPNLLVGKSEEISQSAEQNARRLLGRHPDLFAPEIVDLIAQREIVMALREYRIKRINGYANDDCSKQPGITVFLTSKGYEKAVEVCEHEGYPIPQTQVDKVEPNLISVRLPKGVYAMSGSGPQIYQETITDDDKWDMKQPIELDYDDVVRVEGDTNELWQNYNYNWDGTPASINNT